MIRCSRALVGGAERNDYAFVVRAGEIVDAGDFHAVHERHGEAPARAFPADRLVVPGFVNGHSHAYQILLRGWADDLPFERWRSEALYRVVPKLTPEDVYWVFVAAFGEMLAAGITTVVEFFYLNGYGNAHAEAAIRAARATGVRLVFARAWMDNPQAPEAFRERAEIAAERSRELREQHPEIAICIAPHSLHGASEPMLRAATAFARDEGCDLHIHVAERPEPAGQVLTLERLGMLGDRTVAVHVIHVNAEERELLARRGVRVVHNPSTNLYLGDAIADVVGLRERGVTIGLGTDANVKPSILAEMRAASYLQKLVRNDGAALGAAAAYEMATTGGAKAIGIQAGDLVPGNAADFVVLGAGAIDPWSPPVNGLVYRTEDAAVQATFVGGRRAYTGEPSALTREGRRETAAILRRLS